jgi:hypothetical protein
MKITMDKYGDLCPGKIAVVFYKFKHHQLKFQKILIK